MRIEPLPVTDEIKALLTACDLPASDIPPDSQVRFFGIRQDGALVAVVGLELYPPFGLLRSLAVAPFWRGQGLARKLVAHAESFAAARSVESLFLLTTSAQTFFLKLGYAPATRKDAPAAIRATSQFSALCPASAALLSKTLASARPK